MFYTAALLLAGAVMAACSGSEDMTSDNAAEPQTPAQQGVVELSGTIGGKGNLTRTISETGAGSWEVGDQFAIYYQTTSGHSTAVATINSVNESGSANFKVSLYYPKTGESNVTLIYPASAHNGTGGIKTAVLAEQDGTLAGINSNGLDTETATTGLTVEEQAGKYAKATLNSDVQMQPQVCLYTLNLKKDANTDLSATKLEISDGTHSYTVTPTGGAATNSFTVALLPASDASFTFTATTTESGRVYTKQAVTLGTCTSANVGHVFDKDGNVYEVSNGPGVIYGASFSNKTLESGKFYTSNLTLAAGGGITPVGLIAYVGDGSANSIESGRSDLHGLAIAMNDCSSSNTGTGNWSGSDSFAPWCSQNSATCTSEVSNDVTVARCWKDGISMTSTLASATEHTHYAAKGAANYKYDTSNPNAALPSGTSGWFLPSLGQWQLIIQGLITKKDNLDEPYSVAIEKYPTTNDKMKASYFNSILTNAGATQLQQNGYYWSCSEHNSSDAWIVLFGYGVASTSNKTGILYVRAVLAF